jgi:hypothetical protein
MSDKSIKTIQYGVTDFEVIREDNSYYVDKTSYLGKIENEGNISLFHPPTPDR